VSHAKVEKKKNPELAIPTTEMLPETRIVIEEFPINVSDRMNLKL
jgi:hypothetical protein